MEQNKLVQKVVEKRKLHYKEKESVDNAIEIEDLVVDFGETLALKHISLKMKKGELITLVGPSGCGKTTLLNTIAGLLTPTSGKIIFNKRNVTKLSPKERKLGFVFQNYALYPHLSVYKNIAFPLINDEKWKAGVAKKNELNTLRILEIKLKRAGAKQEELDNLFNLFFDIYDSKKETISYFNTLHEEKNRELWKAKMNLESAKQWKHVKIKELSDKQLAQLKEKNVEISNLKKTNGATKEEIDALKEEYDVLYKKLKEEYPSKIAKIKEESNLKISEAKEELKIAKEDIKNNNEIKEKIAKAKRNLKLVPKLALTTFKEAKSDIESKYDIANIEAKLSKEDIEHIHQLSDKIIKLKEVINNEVLKVSKVVGITKNLGKKPTKLSGGQQQRVAIARAIVKNPDILLMDEPLSNLDAKLRITTREWIRKVQQELNITTIFVTHDQEEAMAISDTVVCMSDGEIQQIGHPIELYNKPANTFVGKFIGMPEMKTMSGKVDSTKNVIIDGVKLGKFPEVKNEKEVLVGARAEFLMETTKAKGFKVKIINVQKLGRETLSTVESKALGEMKVFLHVGKDYKVGDEIYLTLPKDKVILFDKKTNERISSAA